jgi:hypothetical protein
MKNYLFIVASLFLSILMCLGVTASAQMVGTNIFLQGRYLEIGIQDNGAFGACGGIPTSYHPHITAAGGGTELGEVYDQGHDGWTVGTPPYMGDYSCVGTRFEGWALQAAGQRTLAFQGCPSGSFTGSLGLTGSNTSYTNYGGSMRANWAGTGMSGQLVVNMQTRVDTNDSWVSVSVKLRNAGASPLVGVYYMRSCDPDNNQSWVAGAFPTNNKIIYQNDTVNRVLVQASETTGPAAKLWLGAMDSRAKAFIYDSWAPTTALDLADVYNQTVPATLGSFYYNFANHMGDKAIGIVFNIGTLAAGDSTILSYAYVFNVVAGLDSAFPPPCTGMPVAGTASANTTIACSSTGILLNLSGYSLASDLGFQWQLSPDSSTWADIAGATAAGYSFSGLSATTYYRCKVTCSSAVLSAFSPGLKISYTTACPCLHSAGIVLPNTSSACSTTAITLDNTGYTSTSAVSLQWQASPDSITWSNIAGATAVPYTFSGLGATNYYRLQAICTATGVIANSDVKKIIYTTICSCVGTPVGGTATASTTYCSACTLSLDLTGVATLLGITYQWERSGTGTSGWSDIAGATSIPFTISPSSSSYYRCKSTCSSGGVTAYSSPVYVSYAYMITADSVGTSPDTFCTAVRFFVQVSGVSPLLRLKTYYGDGLKDSLALTASGAISNSSLLHSYATPGTYQVKRILYDNNMPQDSIVRSYEHLYCKTVPIKLYLDYDGNCTKGITEPFNSIPLKIQVDSNGTPVDTYSVTSGLYYKATGPVGTVYGFRVLPGSRYVSCPTSGVIYVTTTATVNTYPIQYFGLSCSAGSLSDLAASVVVPVTGRHDQWGHIYLRNNYCVSTDASVTLRYSFKYSDHASWHLAPSSMTFPTLTWTLPAVTALAPQKDMYFVGWAPMSALLTAGDTVTEEITVTATTGTDCDLTNNVIFRVDTVKASCDPNAIEVTPPGCFDTANSFQFTVHFENTGNDTAHHVYILDTLSDFLDPNSMNLVMSSAEVMNIYHYTEAGHNIVKFDFPNIKLLDSSWHGLNDGAFIYTISRKPGLPVGSSIFSRVGIYFDYNDVVMTNTVQNQKGCPITSVRTLGTTHSILLYPNPATDELTITVDPGAFTSVTITNTMGQHVRQQTVAGAQTKVSVQALTAGVYYVTLRGAYGNEVRKFVKW